MMWNAKRQALEDAIAHQIQQTVFDRVLRDGESALEREQRCRHAARFALDEVGRAMLDNVIGGA